LNRFYGLTDNRDHLRKAIEAFNDAAKSYQKLNLTSRMAECQWKAARTYDTLGEYLKAADSFEYASDNYRTAAEKIPQLKEFYKDHALYMQAWTEIEKARHHHVRQEHNLAEGHFEKASAMHKSLKHWSYLTPNYSAWTQLEHAEDLSRKDQCEEAIPAFKQATCLFKETKESLHMNLGKIEDQDEKQMATKMLKATDLRHEYCIGRITLEEAKTLDKKGDHFSSSEKYGSAARIFEKIAQEMESEHGKKELQLIATLSQAWQRMTLAEAEESPHLYLEASQLFEKAKELSSNEKNRTLMSGHSRFCKALEVGTRFADSRDPNLHATAIQHLESAATNYVKAGFQSASEFAKATELLFDAYMQVDKAKKESEPEKKAQHYAMAEKILQSSAGSFMKAEHPEKREQVLRLLEKVREERELAKSLCEVIHSPPIVSTTTAFAIPGPTHENAVGLERFEHADIQANLIIRHKELKIGDDLNLEIELVNAGKGPALLIKLAEVIPKGFDVAQKPETYRVEDSYLNMKGKRLDPLKTEEVKLVLKPKVQGTFPLKPRIHYLDENGKYKSYEVEPITVTVKELGIKGWIMGEKRQ
jgi:tetratricopeptide (TPR) repeat protein